MKPSLSYSNFEIVLTNFRNMSARKFVINYTLTMRNLVGIDLNES